MPNLPKAITFLILINIFFVQFDQVQAQQKTQTSLHNTSEKTETPIPAKNNETLTQQIVKPSPTKNNKGYSCKDILDMAESVVMILAIILGGIWAYWNFEIRRQKHPRAKISYIIKHLPISDNKVLLHVKVHIENIGEILLEMESGFTRVYRILPISNDDMLLIETDEMKRCEKGKEIEWPEIDEIKIKYMKGDLEIEPNESDEVRFDFILNSEEQDIFVYSHFENIKKLERELGWEVSTIYDLRQSG